MREWLKYPETHFLLYIFLLLFVMNKRQVVTLTFNVQQPRCLVSTNIAAHGLSESSPNITHPRILRHIVIPAHSLTRQLRSMSWRQHCEEGGLYHSRGRVSTLLPTPALAPVRSFPPVRTLTRPLSRLYITTSLHPNYDDHKRVTRALN